MAVCNPHFTKTTINILYVSAVNGIILGVGHVGTAHIQDPGYKNVTALFIPIYGDLYIEFIYNSRVS